MIIFSENERNPMGLRNISAYTMVDITSFNKSLMPLAQGWAKKTEREREKEGNVEPENVLYFHLEDKKACLIK